MNLMSVNGGVLMERFWEILVEWLFQVHFEVIIESRTVVTDNSLCVYQIKDIRTHDQNT